jgi:hypothetical protein
MVAFGATAWQAGYYVGGSSHTSQKCWRRQSSCRLVPLDAVLAGLRLTGFGPWPGKMFVACFAGGAIHGPHHRDAVFGWHE